MAEPRLTERQQATADRNVAAILDATEELLARRGQASISAVAKHSGVSRVTVYAHFPTAEALLEAAVERAVGQTMSALQAANLDEGPPVEALERLVATAWRPLARYSAMAQAVAEQMTPEAVARTHRAAHHTLGALVERGRADGSFRSDLPVRWLGTTRVGGGGQAGPDRGARRGPDPDHHHPRPVRRRGSGAGREGVGRVRRDMRSD